MWRLPSNIILLSLLVVGCASPTRYEEKIQLRIQEKPFKVCPDEPTDDDYPCVKLRPTPKPVDRGFYQNPTVKLANKT